MLLIIVLLLLSSTSVILQSIINEQLSTREQKDESKARDLITAAEKLVVNREIVKAIALINEGVSNFPQQRAEFLYTLSNLHEKHTHDVFQCFDYAQKASEYGHAKAQRRVAFAYSTGMIPHIKLDPAKALAFYFFAAANGKLFYERTDICLRIVLCSKQEYNLQFTRV